LKQLVEGRRGLIADNHNCKIVEHSEEQLNEEAGKIPTKHKNLPTSTAVSNFIHGETGALQRSLEYDTAYKQVRLQQSFEILNLPSVPVQCHDDTRNLVNYSKAVDQRNCDRQTESEFLELCKSAVCTSAKWRRRTWNVSDETSRQKTGMSATRRGTGSQWRSL